MSQWNDARKLASVQGWTRDEYMQCPELVGRLHSRILDLQDALSLCAEAFQTINASNGATRRAEQAIKDALRGEAA